MRSTAMFLLGDPGQIRTADLPLRSFNNVKTNAFICNISSFCIGIYCSKYAFCKLFRMFSIHSIRISFFFVLRFLIISYTCNLFNMSYMFNLQEVNIL